MNYCLGGEKKKEKKKKTLHPVHNILAGAYHIELKKQKNSTIKECMYILLGDENTLSKKIKLLKQTVNNFLNWTFFFKF